MSLVAETRNLVAKELVHKAHAGQVLLRRPEALASQRLSFEVAIPPEQQLRREVGRLTVAETLRQATIYLAHSIFGVPIGHAFMMDRMTVRLPESMPATSRLTAEIDSYDVVFRRGRLASLVSTMVIADEFGNHAEGEGYLRVAEPAMYRRLRGPVREHRGEQGPATNQEPGTSGLVRVRRDGDVNRFAVSYDDRDPLFFDHWVDHVPGMLLFEAMNESAVAAVGGGNVASFDGTFLRFAELGRPMTVAIEDLSKSGFDKTLVTVSISQESVGVVAAARLHLSDGSKH